MKEKVVLASSLCKQYQIGDLTIEALKKVRRQYNVLGLEGKPTNWGKR